MAVLGTGPQAACGKGFRIEGKNCCIIGDSNSSLQNCNLAQTDEDTVKTAPGDHSDKVAAAFADEFGVVAKALAEQVVADAKADYTAGGQAYADHLQYKRNKDNGQGGA